MAARTEDELLELSTRLLTTLTSYFRVGRRLAGVRLGLSPAGPTEVQDAMVESFALHTRSLTDFFYTFRRGRSLNDAFAFDYFESPETWRETIGPPGVWISRVRLRADRASATQAVDQFGEQIAHLTHHVPPPAELARGWPVMQLASEIGIAAATFSRAVDIDKLPPGFRTALWREIPVTAKLGNGILPLALWTRPEIRIAHG